MTKLSAQIEALLFTSGKPLSFTKLAALLKEKSKTVKEAAELLSTELSTGERGVRLVITEIEAQLVSAPEVAALTRKLVSEEFEGKLSRAALETLAIIAYRQPISRPEIDAIRGVNSSVMLRTLLIRGLVDRRRRVADARLNEYFMSADLMKLLGISRAGELELFTELNQKIKLTEQEALALERDQKAVTDLDQN